MFGYSIARIKGRCKEPECRGNLALFKRRKVMRRGDIILVRHPEFGTVVRKVSAIGRKGNVHFKGAVFHPETGERLGAVPREDVTGVMILRLL